jgi:hypothetical protein
MNKLDINIGDKFRSYTIISEPFMDGKYRKVKCRCICGKIRKVHCGNLRRLTCCKSCACKQKYRIFKKGEKRYSLTFIKYIENKKIKRNIIKAKCDCGNIIEILASEFGKSQTCGCIRTLRGCNNRSFKGYEYISKTYFSYIFFGAKKRNLEFDIDIEYINALLIQQNHKCALTKLPIKLDSRSEFSTASLDRIDNNIGYTKTNIQWVHKNINRMKSDFTQDYFIEMCKFVTNKNPQ